MKNRSPNPKTGFSLRQAFSLTSAIIVALGALYSTYALWNIFQGKRTELNLRLEKTLAIAGGRADSIFRDARSTVHFLILDLPLVLNEPSKVFGDWLKNQGDDHLPRNPALYDLYFAFAEKPARRIYRSQAMAYAVTRNLDYFGTPAFDSPSTFNFSVSRDASYQKNPQEIWYHGALSAPGIFRTPLYFDSTYFKQVMISVTQALRDPATGEALGVAGVDITAQSFSKILSENEIGKTGGVLLADLLGHPVVPFLGRDVPMLGYKYSLDSANRVDFVSVVPQAPSLNCDSATHQVQGTDGQTYIFQGTPLREPGLCIIAYQARSEAYAALYRSIEIFSALFLLALFIFLYLTRRLARFVIKNIDTLLANIKTNRRHFTEAGTAPRFSPLKAEGLSEMAYIADQLNILYERLDSTLKEVREEKDRAELATKTKSRFLSVMSHEIRTPLNAMIGLTDVLLLSPLNSEQGRYLQILQRSGQSLLRILNDILDFSRLEAGKFQIERHDFDLYPFLYEVENLMRFSAEAKGLRFHVIAPSEEYRLHGDSLRIRQALLNFIGNAIKFTSEGTIEVRVAVLPNGDPDSRRFKFEICDSGIGITPEQQTKIFSDFSQADASIPRRFGGTGLGLSISRQIIELLGGEVSFSSEPGKGSTFQFTVPIKVISQRPAEYCGPPSVRVGIIHPKKDTREDTKLPALKNKKIRLILVVDDDENNHHLIDAYLKFHPELRAVHTTSGTEAIERLKTEKYELILMDMEMPERNGLSVTDEIRRLEKEGLIPRRPIIILSANTFPEDRKKSLDAGADEHVPKPLKLDQFNELLKRWIPKP